MSYDIIYPDTSSDRVIEIERSNKSFLYKNQNLPAISTIKEIQTIKNDDSTSQRLEFIDSDEITKIKEFSKLEYSPKIIFDEDIKKEIYQDFSFMRFISEVEEGLFYFSQMYKIHFDSKIYFQQDWEVKELKNIILKVKFQDILFKEELIFWKELSHFVRKILRMTELHISSKKEYKDFKNYNKLFYIKVDLA